jgi:hypothetical protein
MFDGSFVGHAIALPVTATAFAISAVFSASDFAGPFNVTISNATGA